MKSGKAEKYIRAVQGMYETEVRCAVGVAEGFKVEVGMHHGSSLTPFSFAMAMDRQDEIRQESPCDADVRG